MKEYMKEVSVENAIKASRTDTLCWDCQNAVKCGGGVLLDRPNAAEARKRMDR